MNSGSTNNLFSTIVDSVIRYKWLLIAPVVATMILIHSYTEKVDYYKSSAIITFSTEYALAQTDPGILATFQTRIRDLVTSLKFGETLRQITKLSYPEVKPDENPPRFNGLTSKLGSKNGIKLAFRRDNYRALTVSYTAKDPNEAYNVVKATIDTLKGEAKSNSARRVKKSEEFLLRDMERYRSQISTLDREIVKLTNGVGDGLSGTEVFDIDSRGSIDVSAGFRSSRKDNKSIAQLEIELAVQKNELERLKEKLTKKDFGQAALAAFGGSSKDKLLEDLRLSIVAKTKEQNLLTSQGFRDAHPKRRAVQAEINSLEKLFKTRVKELESGTKENSLLAVLDQEQKVREKISEKAEDVAALEEKIAALKIFKEEFKAQSENSNSELNSLARLKTKLEALHHEKSVLLSQLNIAAEELERTKRLGRADAEEIGLIIEVSEAPRIPRNPVPLTDLPIYAMGLAMSLASGVALVTGVKTLDTSISNIEELQSLIEAPVIGGINQFNEPDGSLDKKPIWPWVLSGLLVLFLASDIVIEKLFLG